MYAIDFEKKEIYYTDKIPDGYLFALKKVFQDQGFKIEEVGAIGILENTMKTANWTSGLGTSGVFMSGSGTTTIGTLSSMTQTYYDVKSIKNESI